ncbi:MAG: hypothetical protein IKD79_04160, partial [Oscillospiraceae bacterium]|nr:hypothetical protein [Oscillospiraceae bacterium]
MSIVKMKKLRVIALREDLDTLMRRLMRLGCVQVDPRPAGVLSDPDAAALLTPERAGLALLRTQQNEMHAALKVLQQYAPEKKKLLSSRPEVSESEFLDRDAMERDLAAAEDICEWDSRVRRITSEESRLRTEIEALLPWESLDMPLNGAGTKNCGVALGSAMAEIELSSVWEAAESVSEDVEIVLVSDDETQHCFVVVAMREELAQVMDAIRAIGCTQVTFPGLEGTARENIRRLEREYTELGEKKAGLIRQLEEQGSRAADLRLSADRMDAEVARAENTERLAGTDNIVVLEGWCPAEKTEKLIRLLDGFDCAYDFSEPDQEEYPQVPVSLKNSHTVEPMNLVTEMYSLPAYDGVDPNP